MTVTYALAQNYNSEGPVTSTIYNPHRILQDSRTSNLQILQVSRTSNLQTQKLRNLHTTPRKRKPYNCFTPPAMNSEEFHHNFNFSMPQHCSVADADSPVTTNDYNEVEKLIKQLQIAIAKLRRKPPDKTKNTDPCKTALAPEDALTPDTTTGIGVAEAIPDLTDTSPGLVELVQTALSPHIINVSPDLTDTSPDPKTNCTSSCLAEHAQTPADINTPFSSSGLAELV